MKVVELLAMAKQYQQTTLALTDINNTSACINFVREAANYGIKPIVGIDFRNGVEQQFVALAENNEGFCLLNQYLSKFLHDKNPIPERAPKLANTFIVYPFHAYQNQFFRLLKNEFIGISLEELKHLPLSPWRSHGHKFVLLQTVTFRNKRDFNVHRLLRAIDNNTLLAKLRKTEVGIPTQNFQQNEYIEQALKDFEPIKKNTQRLLEKCAINFDFKGSQLSGAINQNMKTFTDSNKDDQKLIFEECEKGLKYRYPDEEKQKEVLPRLKKELSAITTQNFTAYFLVNWDMLNFARSQNFFYVGRGSGANSIVAYVLRITDVDPVKLDLYFERFINPYRENPPDFDIDFSWKDRDAVTDYLFQKYGGNGRIALVATYNSFTYKSLIRELGKVFGLPKDEIDQLSAERKVPSQNDEYVKLIYKYSSYMDGIPSNLSVHAGGILISEKPIHYFSATSLPPKGYPLVQFDMVHAEDVGLYKYDILSQRGLGKIKESSVMVKNSGKEPDLDLHDTERFYKDEKIKALLRKGDAMGCFYIESPAMRMLLKKLKTDTYLSLVAASSIIRPGVAKSGMMREYISRSQSRNEEWRKTTPEVMQNLMAETYGVMVYQEDVIRVAHHFAGLTLGEADMMRRGMSGKFRSRAEFDKVRQRFFKSCAEKGYEEKLTAEVWRQTESFAGYAFSKGHSASYAVESYQSLYLKAHYPMEFIVGVLNNGGGFYSTEMYFHEAKQLGAKIEAPCINNSKLLSVLVGENTIYMGFHLVRDLESRTVERLVEEREHNGHYLDLANFVNRVHISIETLRLLIRSGAFCFSGKTKQQLLWQVHQLLGKTKKPIEVKNLFQAEIKSYKLPKLDQLDFEEAFDQMELFGFPLCSPFLLLKEKPTAYVRANEIISYLGKYITVLGYLVTVKNTKTTKGDLMQFGTFVDEFGDWIDTVHFPDVARTMPFRGKGCYAVYGKVVEEFGYATIEVARMQRVDYVERK